MANQGLLNAGNMVVDFYNKGGFGFDTLWATNTYQLDRAYVPDTAPIKDRFAQAVRVPFAKADSGMSLSKEDLTLIVNAYTRSIGAIARVFVGKQNAALKAGKTRIVPISEWLTQERYNTISSVNDFINANRSDPTLADSVAQLNSFNEMIDQETKNLAKAEEMKKERKPSSPPASGGGSSGGSSGGGASAGGGTSSRELAPQESSTDDGSPSLGTGVKIAIGLGALALAYLLFSDSTD